MRIGTMIGSIVCQVGDKFPYHGLGAYIIRTPPVPSRVFFYQEVMNLRYH